MFFKKRIAPVIDATSPPTPVAEPPVAETPEIVTLRNMSTDRALWRLAGRELEIGTVIDIGASDGRWSAVCEKHYPACHYLLVEAHEPHAEALETYCAARPKAQYVLAVAGDECGEVHFYFDDRDLFAGAASKIQIPGFAHKVVRQITIDKEIGTRALPGPYMVKLDTHGYEVPILLGAKETLRKANLVVIETYNFRPQEGVLLFHEMVAYMRERGFGVIDMSEPLWREFDRALWQIDLFFVPLDRPEFRVNSFR